MKELLKTIVPQKIWKETHYLYHSAKLYRKPKIFCISMQRNGTTSCGRFLKEHGFRVAGYGQHSAMWTNLWLKGDYNSIFNSSQFRSFQAFEDNPWWFPDFYRVLNSRFPRSKFILFYRDSDEWFDSMLRHKEIKTLVNYYVHNKVYRKLNFYYDKIDNDFYFEPNNYDKHNAIPFKELKDYYVTVYEEHNREVIEYFKKYAPNKLFHCHLKNEDKWKQLSEFLSISMKSGYNIHVK